MSRSTRMLRRALVAAGASGTVLAGVALAAPGAALAAPGPCSNIFGSGSTLQTQIQQNAWAPFAGIDGAFAIGGPGACSNTTAPTVSYNLTSLGEQEGTGSGAGLTEFALQGATPAITPSESANGIKDGNNWLDAFIGTDDPPTAAAITTAETASGAHPETVPVVQAPVAVIVKLPASCTFTGTPVITNSDLDKTFLSGAHSTTQPTWSTILTDGGATSPTSQCAVKPVVDVRTDSSGTSFAIKQYLSQIDTFWSTPHNYVSDAVDWPGTVNSTGHSGSGGEASGVFSGDSGADTTGAIGYVNLADAVSAGFTRYSVATSPFWLKVQDDGTGAIAHSAQPDTGGSPDVGNCSATGPNAASQNVDAPDWSTIHVANTNTHSGTTDPYPICTLTYDIGWNSYTGTTLGPDYAGKYTGETAAGVAASTKAYLEWLTTATGSGGQTALVLPQYYAPLPTAVTGGGGTSIGTAAANTAARL